MVKIGPDVLVEESKIAAISKGRDEDEERTPHIVFYVEGHEKPIKVLYDLSTRQKVWDYFVQNSTVVY